MEYVIGVDTGATKSHLALFDTAGVLVDFGRWGPLNHEALPGSFDQFYEELKQFISQVLEKHALKPEQTASAVFGIAGVDTKKQHGIVSEIIEKIGFNKFTLANDAFLGIPAGSPSCTGVCAINGSGSTLAGINKQGKMLQIGGVGYLSADFGGGGMLGKSAISAVYRELFRRGEKTCLSSALMGKLGIEDKYDFIDKMYEKLEDGSINVHDCGKMLFEAAKENDKVASGILRDCGTSYANGISGMIDELNLGSDNEDVNVVFAGSVFVKGGHPIVIDTIKDKLKINCPGININYNLLKTPPVAGAVYWALNNSGIGGKSSYYEKVCKQLSNID
ncbi:MAG: hypothetical protein FWC06_00635 [Treponema sp.]|nr:hypothetical protein [Treponema sp.]